MPNHDYILVQPSDTGTAFDGSAITYVSSPTTRFRERLVVGSDSDKDGLAGVIAEAPDIEDFGLVVRPIPFLTAHPGAALAEYGTVTAVAVSTETTVVSYTVAAGKTLYLRAFNSSGDLPARFVLYVDGSPKLAGRNSVAFPDVAISLDAICLPVEEGLTVTVKVTHYQAGLSGSFDGTILGYVV